MGKEMDFGTFAVVPEPDPERSKKQLFTPIRQVLFWLRQGENPNETERTQARNPFVMRLSGDQQRKFETRLQGAVELYRGKIKHYAIDDKNQMIIGREYIHEEKGIPAVFTVDTPDGLCVVYTWLPPDVVRSRLK